MGSRSSASGGGRRFFPTPTSRSCTSTPRAAPTRIQRHSRRSSERWSRRSCRPKARQPRPRSLKFRLTLCRLAALLLRALDQERRPVEPLPDLVTLSDADLKLLIADLTREENEVSYQRRLLHGKIDILRAELVARLQKTGGTSILDEVDVDHLTDILTSRAAPQP